MLQYCCENEPENNLCCLYSNARPYKNIRLYYNIIICLWASRDWVVWIEWERSAILYMWRRILYILKANKRCLKKKSIPMYRCYTVHNVMFTTTNIHFPRVHKYPVVCAEASAHRKQVARANNIIGFDWADETRIAMIHIIIISKWHFNTKKYHINII